MRFHKLTISLEVPQDVPRQIASAVRAFFMSSQPALTPAQLQELDAVLEEQTESRYSQLAQLAGVTDTETIGQLKKAAALRYLPFLEQQMELADPARPFVADLVRRLRLLQDFLQQADRPDEDYDLHFQGTQCNLRVLFSQANAFDDLPVFPLMEGFIGETTDRAGETRSYVFGAKLKLNGPVQRYGKVSSFDYHLDLLRGKQPTRPERLARLAVLYHVAFSSFSDHAYDPIQSLESDLLPRLRKAGGSSDPAEGLAVLSSVASACQRANVDLVANSLRRLLKRTTAAATRSWDVQVGVRSGILLTNRTEILDEGRLFKDVFADERKGYLAYLDVAEASVSDRDLFKLRGQITFEDVQCFDGKQPTNECRVSYDTGESFVLPVFLDVRSHTAPATAPQSPPAATTASLRRQIEKADQRGLVVACSGRGMPESGSSRALFHQPEPSFVYRYVFALVTYLGVRLVAALGAEELQHTGDIPAADRVLITVFIVSKALLCRWGRRCLTPSPPAVVITTRRLAGRRRRGIIGPPALAADGIWVA